MTCSYSLLGQRRIANMTPEQAKERRAANVQGDRQQMTPLQVQQFRALHADYQ